MDVPAMKAGMVRRGAQVVVVLGIVVGGVSSSELGIGVRGPAEPRAQVAPPEAPEAPADEPATAPRERAADAAAELAAQTKRLRSRVERLTALRVTTRGEQPRLEEADQRCRAPGLRCRVERTWPGQEMP